MEHARLKDFPLSGLKVWPLEFVFDVSGRHHIAVFEMAKVQYYSRRKTPIERHWEWVEQLQSVKRAGTWRLAMLLLYEHWRNGGRDIALSNVIRAVMPIKEPSPSRP